MRRILSSLTTRGRSFLSAGLTTSVCALLLGQNELLRVGLLLTLLPVITAGLATRSRYLLACHREVFPARVQADAAATVRLRLENPGRIPTGLLLLEDQVPYVLGSRPRFIIDQLRPRWTRDITYPVRASVRGRYQLGPMSVRVTDPFGFVELTRSFTHQTMLTVTPKVHPLAQRRMSGDWSGSGEQRPRAFAAAGTEDVTVREYRQGDDMRRIHWPSTARSGELMVRREEQPHHSRATLVLDNRGIAHRGKGPASTFEWAVSAVASIGAYLNSGGFTIRLVTADTVSTQASWHDRGVSRAAELELLLDELSLIDTTRAADITSHTDHTPAGVVVAVVGHTRPVDVASLNAQRVGSAQSYAIVLDIDSTVEGRRELAESVRLLRGAGWTVATAGPGDRIAEVWGGLTAAENAKELRSWTSADALRAVASSGGPAA